MELCSITYALPIYCRFWNGSERGSFARSDKKCHNCGKKGHINKDSRLKGHGSSVNRESSARSDIICHKCGNKGHIHKDCRSNGNGSNGSTPKKSINELPKWVTRKPVDSDTEDLITATMTLNNKKYKWCMYCNNGQGTWGFHWKFEHIEWKEKQVKNNLVQFSDSSTNSGIYCSYPMATSDNYIKE